MNEEQKTKLLNAMEEARYDVGLLISQWVLKYENQGITPGAVFSAAMETLLTASLIAAKGDLQAIKKITELCFTLAYDNYLDEQDRINGRNNDSDTDI